MEHSALSREPPEITIRTHKSEITYARARGDPLGGADAQVHAPHAGRSIPLFFHCWEMARFLMTCLFKSGGRNWGEINTSMSQPRILPPSVGQSPTVSTRATACSAGRPDVTIAEQRGVRPRRCPLMDHNAKAIMFREELMFHKTIMRHNDN